MFGEIGVGRGLPVLLRCARAGFWGDNFGRRGDDWFWDENHIHTHSPTPRELGVRIERFEDISFFFSIWPSVSAIRPHGLGESWEQLRWPSGCDRQDRATVLANEMASGSCVRG